MNIGFGNLITATLPDGMYNEATNPGSKVIWAQQESCSVVSQLINDTSKLNNVYGYGGLDDNSNSSVFTLLTATGLINQMPVPPPAPPRAPGWGDLFLIP